MFLTLLLWLLCEPGSPSHSQVPQYLLIFFTCWLFWTFLDYFLGQKSRREQVKKSDRVHLTFFLLWRRYFWWDKNMLFFRRFSNRNHTRFLLQHSFLCSVSLCLQSASFPPARLLLLSGWECISHTKHWTTVHTQDSYSHF